MEPADELSKVKLNALLRLTMRYNQLVDLLRRSRLTTNKIDNPILYNTFTSIYNIQNDSCQSKKAKKRPLSCLIRLDV